MKQNKKVSKVKESKKSKANLAKDVLTFPVKLLEPVAHFLQDSIHNLEKRRKDLSQDDPFRDSNRLLDNASPDADAAEQFGHLKTAAVKEQLDKKLKQTKKALARLKSGKYGFCEDCGKMIDTDRLTIYPEATLCVKCEAKREK